MLDRRTCKRCGTPRSTRYDKAACCRNCGGYKFTCPPAVPRGEAGLPPRAEIEQRLLEHREIDPNTQCWIWSGAWHSSGYGRLSLRRHNYSVSKLAALVWKGASFTQYVVHAANCRTSACFNPEHLIVADTRKGLSCHRRPRKPSAYPDRFKGPRVVLSAGPRNLD